MTRREFIESHGATCRNWQWSWSFINEKEKFIIFGAWEKNIEKNRQLILEESWKRLNGKKKAAYGESRDHIRKIEEEGYKLKTFKMVSDKERDDNMSQKIDSFSTELVPKQLKQVNGKWYAHTIDLFRL